MGCLHWPQQCIFNSTNPILYLFTLHTSHQENNFKNFLTLHYVIFWSLLFHFESLSERPLHELEWNERSQGQKQTTLIRKKKHLGTEGVGVCTCCSFAFGDLSRRRLWTVIPKYEWMALSYRFLLSNPFASELCFPKLIITLKRLDFWKLSCLIKNRLMIVIDPSRAPYKKI